MRKPKLALLGVSAALAVMLATAAGCTPTAPDNKDAEPANAPAAVAQPQDTDDAKTAADATSNATNATSAETQGHITATTDQNYLDRTSGNFPDTYNSTNMLNAGNRGCNSCHEDLFDLMYSKDGAKHILCYTGFDKVGRYTDCEPCHRRHTALTGPYFGDLLHASHYGSQTFVDNGGNCWSCHALNSEGKIGEYQLLLWDDFYDTPAVGGYPDAETNEKTRDWIMSRGFNSYYLTGYEVEDTPQISATFDQEITDPEDVFIVHNWGDDLIDFDEMADPNLTFTIEGVNNPRSFSAADLEAMPQESFTAYNSCATNGFGGLLSANIPCTGVPMSYLIEQCGGLVDGINAVKITASDTWSSQLYPAEVFIEDTYVCTKYYDKTLTVDQGFPFTVVCCGMPAAQWVKEPINIKFTEEAEKPVNLRTAAFESDPKSIFPVNSGWFDNDGEVYKLGDTISLKGASWSWSKTTAPLESIAFSFDMGQNWTEYQVNEVVPDFDEYQWVTYTVDWTPEKAGTYMVKVLPTDADGNQPYKPISLILTVEE